jgi:alpha-tubulin suppressor-like RCC1 family protein
VDHADRGVGLVTVRTVADHRAWRPLRRGVAIAAVLLTANCGDGTGPSTPTHLAFVVQPSSVGIEGTLVPGLVVVVRDAAERTVWSWTDTIEVALGAGSGAATLHGTTRVAPVSGTAVFGDLALDDIGADYRLLATSGTLEAAVSEPFTVHDAFTADTIAGGYYHTCALQADGTAHCWGANGSGQVGDGTQTDRFLPTPVATSLRFTVISAGDHHTCALTSDGSAYCWGANHAGQLGNGTTDSSLTPRRVEFADPLVTLEAGWEHTCAMTAGGAAVCWGENWGGQLGDGTDTTRLVPTPVAGGVPLVSVDAGFYQTCGLGTDGNAYCWGYDYANSLGLGPSPPDSVWTPTAVLGGHQFSAVIAGGGPCHGYSCGITTAGDTYCWGTNTQGRLFLPEPTLLDGDPGFSTVAPGGAALCGLDADGALYCWGDGYYGSVGVGTQHDVYSPTPILPELRFTSVVGGGHHTCAVTTDGATYCWGANDYGQLGRTIGGSTEASSGWSTPLPVWRP